MAKVIIVTCDQYPDLFASDSALRDALAGRGVAVIVRPWQAPGFWDDLRAGDAVVVRATWDYPDHPARFEGWLTMAQQAEAVVFNPPALMRWSIDKRYVLELAARGVRVPASVLVAGAGDVDAAFERLAVELAVIKPCRGASGRGVQKVTRDTAKAYLAVEGTGRLFLVQEMLPEIVHGEISFVFLSGRFSHAVRKIPAEGDFRVNSAYGPARVERIEVARSFVDAAAAVLAVMPQAPLYARIDGVPRDGAMIWLEAEVTEPTLYMHLHPPAAEMFAAAILERLA